MNRYKCLIKPLIVIVIALILCFFATGLSLALEAKEASSLTLSSNKNSVQYGDTIRVSGSLSPVVSGVTINIYQRVVGATDFTLISNATVNDQGAFSVDISPTANADFMASWAGDSEHEAGQSAVVRVNVMPLVSIQHKGRTAAVHKKARIYGSVRPSHNGKKIWLQYLVGKTWRTSKSATTNANSQYSFKIAPKKLQTYRFRVLFYDDDHSRAYSGTKSIAVVWPNPFGVSSKYARYIVVVKARYKLYLIQHGNITRTFPVVVGKPSTRTPTASWKIGEKNPRGGGVQGPLVLRLYRGGYTRYGIHGTNQEYLLRRWPRGYSHGCIRMYNRDVLWLSARVPIGTFVSTI